jgi:hypothetical protein
MKIRILFYFFLLRDSFSQSVNDFKAVIVPLKFEFLKKARTNTVCQLYQSLNWARPAFKPIMIAHIR